MDWSRIFILRPKATLMLMVAIFAVGAVAYLFLPIAALPQIDFPVIQVHAALPGASAETMATSVAAPLERQLAVMPGVADLSSTNSAGSTQITVEFDLSRDINAAAQDVQSAINAAAGNLPKDMRDPPTFEKVNPAEATILSLAVTSDTLPIAQVDDYADNYVAQRVSRITGVGLVDLNGEQKPAVRVQINPVAVAAKGLSLEDVRTAIAAATLSAPKGSLNGPARSVSVATNDQVFDPHVYDDLIIAYRNGSPVRLSDVGQVSDGVEDVTRGAWIGAERTVIVDLHKQQGSNVNQTVQRVKDLLPDIVRSLPPSVHVQVVSDRTQTINAAIAEVQGTLLLTIAVVFVVVLAFLRRLWPTVIAGLVVPLSLIGTFAVMFLLRFSLNNISLMGLTIAVGFVIDDAIVMVENIVARLEQGEAPLDAALAGARQIGFTVISISISLIAVFIPVLFLGGVIGRMFREFGATVCVAVAISAVISLTLTPALCGLLRWRRAPAGAEGAAGRLAAALERLGARGEAAYERGLDLALGHRAATLLVLAATLALSVVVYLAIPKGFFPQQDTGLIVGATETTPDIAYPAMSERMGRLIALVGRDPDVAAVYGWIGPQPSESQGRVLIALKPFEQRKAGADQIMRRLKGRIAGLADISLHMQSRQDLRVGAHSGQNQYQYTLEDADPDELYAWTPRMVQAMRALPQLSEVDADLQLSGEQLMVQIDRQRAAQLGVDPQTVDAVLYDAFGQRQVATIYKADSQERVVLEVDPRHRLDAAALDALYAPSKTGAQVPFSAFVSLKTAAVPLSIGRQDQLPAVSISFALAPQVSLGAAVRAIDEAKARIGAPLTLQTGYQGSAKAYQTSLASEPWLIGAAILAVYVVLGILYESFLHPLTILSTLPSAGLGALLGLWLSGRDLDLLGLIGIILLIGIVKKNAIMMIDFALDAERNGGMAPEAAIRLAAVRRFRPIMMTTAAALLGALPLAMASGAGAELRVPLGIAMVFGLLVSQLLTLFTTPVVYVALSGLAQGLAPAPHRTGEAA